MDQRLHISRVLRWTAMITGTLALVFLVWMFIGHLVGHANGPNGMTFHSTREVAAFFFFPVCTIAGLAIAYRWELVGAVLVLFSLAGLFVLRPDLMTTSFWLWVLPAALYLGAWWLRRRAA